MKFRLRKLLPHRGRMCGIAVPGSPIHIGEPRNKGMCDTSLRGSEETGRTKSERPANSFLNSLWISWRGFLSNLTVHNGGRGFRDMGQLHAASASAFSLARPQLAFLLSVAGRWSSLESDRLAVAAALWFLAFLLPLIAADLVDGPDMAGVRNEPLVRKQVIELTTHQRLVGCGLTECFSCPTRR